MLYWIIFLENILLLDSYSNYQKIMKIPNKNL